MEQNNPAPVSPAPQNTTLPITDVRKYIKQKYSKAIAIAVSIAVVIEILIIGLSVRSALPPRTIFGLTFYPVIILAAAYAVIRQKAEDAFFQQFAALNNFSFQKTGLPSGLNGSLFFIGRSRTGRDLVSGTFQNTPFALFNYQYIVGEGKSSQVCIYTCFKLDYQSQLPPLFLRAKDCVFGGYMLGDISQNDKERVTLEGDFDKSFDLWTSKGFELEVLQVFAPDFMEQIQNNWKNFSLEFIGNQVYVYSRHMVTSDQELESMYSLVQYLVSKITPLAREMKGDITAMDQYYTNPAQ